MERLRWMYKLVSRVTDPPPILFECPLCHCLVGGNIRDHTKYHEDRGEEDN